MSDNEASFLTEGLDTAPAALADTAPKDGRTAEQAVQDQLKTAAAAKNWYDPLPEDLRADPNVTKYTSMEGLVKGHVNAVKLLGTDKVPLPKDENDAEGWERYYKAGGRPDDAEAYELERPTELPEGMQWDADAETHFRSLALANGMNQKQFKAIVDVEMTRRIEAHKAALDAQRQYQQQRSERITRELGDQLPTYKANAQAVIKQYGDTDLIAWLEETKAGDDPRFIKAFGRIGRELMGDSRAKTPERTKAIGEGDLEAQIANFRKKHAKALYDNTHPDNRRLVGELTEMTERRFGTEVIR